MPGSRPHKPTEGEVSAKLEAAAAIREQVREQAGEEQADELRADALRRELAELELEAQVVEAELGAHELEAEMEQLQFTDLQRRFEELRMVAAQRLHAQADAEREASAMRTQVDQMVFENERQALIAATDTAAAAEKAQRHFDEAVAVHAEETVRLLELALGAAALEAENLHVRLRESLRVVAREKPALQSAQESSLVQPQSPEGQGGLSGWALRMDKAKAAEETTQDRPAAPEAAHQAELQALREDAALDQAG